MKKNLNKKISSLESLKKLQFWNGIIEKNNPEVNDRIQKLVAFSTW
jgi:hypothetical protein